MTVFSARCVFVEIVLVDNIPQIQTRDVINEITVFVLTSMRIT
jgi:hypothetical protein